MSTILPPASNLGFARGYVPDPPDERDWRFSEMELARKVGRGTLPERATMEMALAPVRDQGAWGSCVAMSFARAIDTRARHVGKALRDYPSEAAIYGVARALEPDQPPGPLPDDGTYPRLAARGLATVGVVAESAFPYTSANLRNGIDYAVVRAGSSARLLPSRGLGWYRLAGAADVKRALASGYPVPLGLAIDTSFEDYRYGIYQRGGATVGGHMVCAIGYIGDLVHIINSWGNTWGDQGFGWIPSWYLDDRAFCFDAYALDFHDLSV